jgi:hypothetical protein
MDDSRDIDITSVLRYNWPWTNHYLLGMDLSKPLFTFYNSTNHAKKPANTAFDVQRYPSYTLRRDGASSAFLQQAWTPSASAKVFSNEGTEYHIQQFRLDYVSAILGYDRFAPDQQDGNPSIQRGFSLFAGVATFSRPIHSPSLSQKA